MVFNSTQLWNSGGVNFLELPKGTHVHVRKVRSFDPETIIHLDHEVKGYVLDAPEGGISVLRYWQKTAEFPDGRWAAGHFCSSQILDCKERLVRTLNSVYEVTETSPEDGVPSFEKMIKASGLGIT